MRTSLKAALAGVAGAGLLLGGAGSLAFWNDTEVIGGTAVNNGELTLSAIQCGAWKLNDSEIAFAPTTDLISPGDLLTRVCTTTITAKGKALTGTLAVSIPELTGKTTAEADKGLLDELQRTSTFKVAAEESALTTRTVTAADDQKAVTVTSTIKFPFGTAVDNDSNNKALGAALADFPLTLTQNLASNQTQ